MHGSVLKDKNLIDNIEFWRDHGVVTKLIVICFSQILSFKIPALLISMSTFLNASTVLLKASEIYL